MKYKLMDIREYVLKLAEVISEVLRVDVEIVDSSFIRIAGTGRYKGKSCVNIEEESFIYKKVFESGKKQVVENPGFHRLCTDCPKKNSCIEKFECCTPIVVEEEVIGVIALICFTDQQKKLILERLKEFTNFLDKMSELISSKAKENFNKVKRETLTEDLRTIVNYIQDNLVVLDEDSEVIFFNKKFQNFINNDMKITDSSHIKISIRDFGERVNINNSTQFTLEINGIKTKVLGCVNDINSSGEKNRLIIFQDLSKVHKTIYEQSNESNFIDFACIIGESNEAKMVLEKAKRVALGHASILITGESGTGKELFARAIHNESTRRKGPFIAINCGAIPDTLLESELFGYVPGAFTGANKNGKIGKFELANNGTLFLDEIGDMPLHLQVKLLRVLQDKIVIPIGSNKPIHINVRVISATNKDLEKMVAQGEFREDLYYRLNVIPLEIPPLRKRKEDIAIIADHFLNKYSNYYQVKKPLFTKEAMQRICSYSWQGNVRELENTIEYIINLIQDSDYIEERHLPVKILNSSSSEPGDASYNLESMEKLLILKAINEFGANTEDKRKVARALGVSLSTLYRKMEKYNIRKLQEYIT